jgi:hypothetical protein
MGLQKHHQTERGSGEVEIKEEVVQSKSQKKILTVLSVKAG